MLWYLLATARGCGKDSSVRARVNMKCWHANRLEAHGPETIPLTNPIHAGQRHVPGHIMIPQLMQRPQRAHTDNPRTKSLVLGVAVCMAGGIYMKDMTGTQYDGMQPIKPYYNRDGQPCKRYGGEEYSDFLRDAFRNFMGVTEFRRQSQHALVVHDRSKAHTSGAAALALSQLQLKAQLLPPRSPDLQPLDYGIFSTSKVKLARELGARSDWSRRVATLKNLIRASPYQQSILQFEKRLKACINVGGQHIDASLKRVEDG
jgi:hypothetical protein